MNVSAGQLVVWLLVGGAAGKLVGMVVQRRRRGYGLVPNLVIGLVGALIGGRPVSTAQHPHWRRNPVLTQ